VWSLIIVLEDSYDTRALSAGVLFHLNKYGEALYQSGARGILRLEVQHAAIVATDVAPESLAVFHFNLEHFNLPFADTASGSNDDSTAMTTFTSAGSNCCNVACLSIRGWKRFTLR
jgi:tRNA G26 N,N-dimethylase Trm1